MHAVWALLALLLATSVYSFDGTERTLLQRRRREADVVVETELELQTALLRLEENQTIELNTPRIDLATTLTLSTPGVTLRGGDGGTLLRCSRRVPQTALIINAAEIRIESLNITHCLLRSAVVVEPVPGNRTELQSVTFKDVQFLENGGRRQGVIGGAVRVDACLGMCRRPVLRFMDCRFSQNKGLYGGAVFAFDADVEVHRSVFEDNAADATGGGLYLTNQLESNLLVEESEFYRNTAHSDEEVESVEEVFGMAQSQITFGMGGAICALSCLNTTIQNSRFVQNTGCSGGGAVAVVHDDLPSSEEVEYVFKLADSYFERNDAFCGDQTEGLAFQLFGRNTGKGGAVQYEEVHEVRMDWRIQNSTFLQNHARIGGAVGVTSVAVSPAVQHIEYCTFEENIALVSAGAVALESANAVTVGSVFRYNKAVYGGAWLVFRRATLSSLADPANPQAINRLEHGQAIFGGGIFAEGGGEINLTALEIRNNTAYRYGGGVRFYNAAGQIVFRGVTVEGNTALTGGGIAILAVMSIRITRDQTGQRSIIRNNTAAIGGGLYYEPGQSIFLVVQIEYTDIMYNEALSLSTPLMRKLVQQGDEFEPLPEANVQMPDVEEQLGNFTLLSFLTDIEEGHGGGLCLTLLNIRLFTVAEIVFSNLTMTHNAAVVGGALSVHMSDLYWNRDFRTSCFPAAYGLDTCQRFAFHNVTVTLNRALYAGGIFATLADGIAVSCSPTSERWITSQRFLTNETAVSQLMPFCTYIGLNFLSDDEDIDGHDAGSRAVYLAVEDWDGPLKTVPSEHPLAVPCPEDLHNDSCWRPLRIAVKDAFGQTIVRGIDDANLELTLVSDSIIGSLRYTAERGIAVINRTDAWGVNRRSTLTIVSEKDRDVFIELELSTRDCYPGEINDDNVCRKCPSEQYGFSPNGTCRGCERDATCNGGASLVPSSGYWHSTPFSPLMHPCIHPDACDYEGREAQLGAFHENASRLDDDLKRFDAYLAGAGPMPDFSEYRQCAPGYEGTFCGSCENGYGHSRTGACGACPEEKARQRGLVFFLASVWLFVLVGMNCAISLLSMDSRVRLVRNELHAVTENAHTLERSPHLKYPIHDASVKTSGGGDLGLSRQASDSVDGALHEILAETVMCTVQLSETLKVESCVTSAALQLQTDWNALLNGLLEVEAGFVGLSTEVLDVPIECNFDDSDGVPASISAWWLRVGTPWIILVALLLVYSLVWWFLKFFRRRITEGAAPRTRRRLSTGFVVITVVSLYFFYIGIVRELLRAINCIEVEEAYQLVSPDNPYLAYAVETGRPSVWAEDTDLACFRGEHLPVGIVGVIGLFLAFIGIVAIVVWLPLNRKHVTKTEFISRYWFLYQAYRKEWFTNAWESTILTRKALVAAVVVFSVHLGPTLQASMCSGILIIAHIMHCAFAPFKDLGEYGHVPEYAGHLFESLHLPKLARHWVDFNNAVHLNSLESASLASSIVFFFSAIVLHDSNSSAVGRASMVAFTFITNVSFLLYMGFRLYAGLHVFLDLKLEMHNAAFMAAHDNSMSLCSLISKLVALIRGSASKHTSNGSMSRNPPQSIDIDIGEDPPNV